MKVYAIRNVGLYAKKSRKSGFNFFKAYTPQRYNSIKFK